MNWDQTTVDVLDNCDRVYLASQCGKNAKGAFDEGVLTILAVCHLTQTGDSDTLLLRKVEASTGDLSRMVHALKRYLEPKLKKVEQTFLSAHIQQTETSESCVRAHHDSPPSPPLEKGRRNLSDHFCLHSGRRTLRRADRNVCPTFTPASSTARQAFIRGWH